MKLNLEEMREIARTLPIGYYLGRKVPVFVEDGNLAYCDVVKGDVHIGVGLLQTAADHIDATDAAEWDRETLLRCLLYHEIGHLLLTPKWYKVRRVKNANGNSYCEEKSNTILNIFEDERLECILSKYFMGVKFKKFVKLVCKGEGGGRKDDIAKIYRAIRLRDAPKDVSDAVDEAIKNLAYIISVTDEWGFNPAGNYVYNAGLYSEEVNALVAKILDSKEESGGGQSQQSQGRSEHEQSKQDSPEQPASKEQSEQEKPDGEQKDEQKDDKSDGESDDKPDADDKSDAENDSKAEENSDSEENSGGDGGDGDGSDGESDKPDEEDSEGDEGGGDADGDESDGDGDADGDGDESDEDSDGDAKGDGEDADDADDSSADDADGGVDGDDCEEESSDGDATGDEADVSGTDDTEDAEDADGKTSCAVSGVLTLPPEYLKEVADKVFATPTNDIENVLRRFAQRIAKQKGAQAAGRWSALTGRIDPRRDAQDKDRIFRRSSDVGDAINTAVHLTLWVDTSVSFCRSVPLLNQILAATYRAMKMSGGKLDVDVVKMNYSASIASPNDWQIVAHGGNNLNSSYVNAWRKTRKKNKRNIDVVVFDGEACCYYGDARTYIDEIVKQIWDSPDCHLVVDHTNGDWTGKLKRAHVTLLTGDYAEALQGEVIKLLDRIL